jgi:hypothetical protein
MGDVTFYEQVDSRSMTTGENAAATLHYVLEGTSSDVTALTLAQSSTALYYQGLVRQSIDIEPVFVDTMTDAGRWNVVVKYGRKPSPIETGEQTYQFDIGGSTMHITQSISTSGKYAPSGKTAGDPGGAINVTDHAVEGVDVTVPTYSWSETWVLTDSQVNRVNYYNLCGTVCNAAFRGFNAGEVLFLGCSGTRRGDGTWEITFKFAASPNKTNFTIGSITVASKKGWEYMWVRYADSVDSTANAVVKKPLAVYIEKVYPDGNMSLLGIGTT